MSSSLHVVAFTPSRAAALDRLATFAPRAGRAYSDDRNYDHGPQRRGNVSALSPWIRHRALTEREAAKAALDLHGLEGADKFIQEVMWRTYWKGWLEMRPSVWTAYQTSLSANREMAEQNGGLRRDLRAAEEGRTGIEGFDDWAQELVETGYLHNHARMWFASIWIFTLRLPWQLGADFFMRHLMDGDPASNTLSWRWVAGLQTRGKTYAATADNIARYTGGRFRPKGLAADAAALTEQAEHPLRPLSSMATHFEGEAALLLTGDDLGVESLPVDWSRIGAVAVADLTADRSALPICDAARDFADGLTRDAIERVRRVAVQADVLGEPLRRLKVSDVLPWLDRHRCRQLVIPETPVGPDAAAAGDLALDLARQGIPVVRVRRPWDQRAWPHATKGFFPFREKIPELLRADALI